MTETTCSEKHGNINLPAEKVPILAKADVCVVGGGTAGFIAAVAAAKTGARTVLIERFGYLGGCTTATYNTTIGWFFDTNGKQIIGGYPWEFLERMQKEKSCVFFDRKNTRKLQIWPPTTKKVALEMITEAGVDLYFYMWASDVIKEGDSIKGVVVQSKGGRAVVMADSFVDASADGDISAFAGAPFHMEEVDNLQQVSCDFTACGVDADRVVAWARENRDKLTNIAGIDEDMDAEGPHVGASFVIPNPNTKKHPDGAVQHIGVMPTVKLCLHRGAVRIQGNVDINPLDPKALTYAETEGIRGAYAHLAFLKEQVPGFENAVVVAQSHLGVRETRQIIADYKITIDDLEQCARFDDVVALNCRSLDYHLKGTVFKISSLKGYHDIPIRALTPKDVDNLVVAGRCISCDHLAQASIRGAGTCMGTGHAAGTVAALAAMNTGKIRELDIKLIQKTLLSQNVILSTD